MFEHTSAHLSWSFGPHLSCYNRKRMLHRHLNHSEWTLAAIDDVIARGRLDDWKQLRDAAASRKDIREADP